MSGKAKLKYEKPVSIDMGRVAPVLGDRCSTGDGAADCSNGLDNTLVPACKVGENATDTCQNGLNAATFCYPQGSGAAIGCYAGDGT